MPTPTAVRRPASRFTALSRWLDRRREHGVVFLRLAVGVHLIVGTVDNVVSWQRKIEFRDFLAAHGFPWPLLSANVSAWAQFVCGGLFVVGLLTRPAAAVMVVNFLVALGMVHLGKTPYAVTFPALFMLAGALFLLVHGPGAWAVDGWLARRRGASPVA
jgi:putative oxidoreductase